MLKKLMDLMDGYFDRLYNDPDGIVINGIQIYLGVESVDYISVLAADIDTGDMLELLGVYSLVSKRFSPSILICDRIQSDDDISWLYDLLNLVKA